MKNIYDENVRKFTDKFKGSFFYTVPDNFLVYEYDDVMYIVDENKLDELIKDSMENNENMFLFLPKLTYDSDVLY